MVNVDFEFFDPQPDVDFHGLKTLLRQLLDVDAQLVDLIALADLILAQPLLGSTVKVESNETDPYAFLTVLNLKEHKVLDASNLSRVLWLIGIQDKPAIKTLTDYLAQRATTSTSLAPIAELLGPSSKAEVGLILTERLINIPAEVAAPMYKMLLEEMAWAVEEKEPYTFSHYLIISKTYLEVESLLDRPGKKKKGETNKEIFYFHPEDEILHRNAITFGDYGYIKVEGEGQADSKRAFQELGIQPQGHMILIEASKFEATVSALEEFLRP